MKASALSNLVLIALPAGPAAAQDAADSAEKRSVTACPSSLTLGRGARVGPDLAGVHVRRLERVELQ